MKHPSALLPIVEIFDDGVLSTTGSYVSVSEIYGLDSEHLPHERLSECAPQLYEGLRSELVSGVQLQWVVEARRGCEALLDAHARLPSAPAEVLRRQKLLREQFLRSRGLKRFRCFLAISLPGSWSEVTREHHARCVAELTKLTRRLSAVLSRTGVQSRRLSGGEIEHLIFEALNPGRAFPHQSQGLTGNRVPAVRRVDQSEGLIELPWVEYPDRAQVGPLHHRVLFLDALPEETNFLMMEAFLHLEDTFRLSLCQQMPEQKAAKAGFEQLRKLYHAASFGGHVSNSAADSRLADANLLSQTLADTGQALMRVGAHLVLSAPSPEALDAKTERVTEALKRIGLRFLSEVHAQGKALGQTFPGSGTTFDRWLMVTSNNAADLAPVFGWNPGDRTPVVVLETARGEPYAFDPMEPARKNHNAMIVGASGAGKSVLVNALILSCMRSGPNAGRVMVVDFAGPENSSYRRVIDVLGGRFIPVLGQGAMNPFPSRREALDSALNLKPSTVSFLTVFLDVLIANDGEDKETLLHRAVVTQALAALYKGRAEPSLITLLDELKRLHNVDAGRQRTCIELLEAFLADPASRLFLGRRRLKTDAVFTIFDLFGVDALPKRMQSALVFLVTERVRALAFESEGAKYVVLDEVAQLLRKPAMVDLVLELYCTARKHRTSVWTVTQQYADFKASAVADTINLNSTTKVFLSHASAAPARKEIAEDFGLNGRETVLFERLETLKGQYSEALWKTENVDARTGECRETSARVRVRLSPFDYQLATSDPKDRERQQRALAAHPELSTAQVLEDLAYGAGA